MDIEPIGGAARNFLRRVRLAATPFQPEADEIELAMVCMGAGYLKRSRPLSPRLVITAEGVSYLDKLARCE